jgi:hypothetical protein
MNLGRSLAQWAAPDFVSSPQIADVGFIHRHLDSGDLYFVANTGNQSRTFSASFRSQGKHAEIWDAFSGKTVGVQPGPTIQFNLSPYESRIVFFSDAAASPIPVEAAAQIGRTDLSRDWQVTFGEAGQAIEMSALVSWTEDPQRRYFSGSATYVKTVEIPETATSPGHSLTLDFGEGTPVAMPFPLTRPNMRAYLESPVREAAQVYANGKLAGYVWHPPYRVDLTPYLKPGKNELRIVVENTAINELAGETLSSNRLLYDRYGVRFIPQGMEHLEPLPSGMLGPLTLIESGP